MIGEKYYNEKGKKVYLYSVLIIPIHNYFYALEDIKYDLARVMDGDMWSHNYDSSKRINTLIYGKYIESETYRIAQISFSNILKKTNFIGTLTGNL